MKTRLPTVLPLGMIVPAGHEIPRFDDASSTEPAAITAFDLTDIKHRPLIQVFGDQ